MDTITLTTKKQLDIFMNPQRQRLLRSLEMQTNPRTPKDLSVELGISPSSVQYHLKKLESLGLVRIDHTETIRGIVAKYYIPTRVIVRLGMEKDDGLANERTILMQNHVNSMLEDINKAIQASNGKEKRAELMTGIAYLAPERAKELQQLLSEFVERYSVPTENTEAWEYGIMYHSIENK